MNKYIYLELIVPIIFLSACDFLNNNQSSEEKPTLINLQTSKSVNSLGQIYGRSDSCSASEAIGAINDFTDCNSFSDTEEAWSIKIGGSCKNISDTNARNACVQVKAETNDVIYGRSDSCSASEAIGAINDFTDCNSFSDTEEAWSIKIGGSCKNISDTNARNACVQVKAETNDVIYGRSDSCSASEAIGAINDFTDCNSFSDTEEAWSIKIGGSCKNISDTNARNACVQVKAETNDVIYGRSDSCSASEAIGAINDFTDCNSFSDTEEAWSIKIGGSCKNISDTNARNACVQVQSM